MSLTKQDLQDIASVVTTAVEASEKRMTGRIDSAIEASEARMAGRIDSAIEASEKRMTVKITESEGRTQDQIDGLTKAVGDLTETVNDLATHLDERLASQDEKIDKILNHVDSIAGQYSRLDDEETVSTALIKQANDKLVNHEQRIERLEKARV
jgi:archaellum component FlaC